MKKNILKKTLIALSMTVSMASMPLAAELGNLDHLDSVPANATVFSGYIKPFPLKLYYENMNTSVYSSLNTKEFREGINEDQTPSGKFFASLLFNFFENADNFESFAKNYGFGDELRAFVYDVDLAPVFKYEAKNSNAIWDILSKAEAASGVKGVKQSLDGVDYTSYLLANDKKNVTELVVATNDNWVTITLKYATGNNDHLKIALGLEKPKEPLNKTQILQDISDKYGFDGTSIGYIDHKRIVDAITGKTPGNFFTEQNNKDLQTPACQADLANIAATWPRTVIGTNALDVTSQNYYEKASVIIEISDAQINETLMQLRGYIPSYLNGSKEQIFSIGLGLNANNIAPAITSLWKSAISTQYECAPLVEMQNDLKATNPAMIGMFTGMANGVKGLSYSLFDADIDFSEGEPKFNKMDQILSLAAENPLAQFMSLSMLNPIFAEIQLPQDGSEIEINNYLPNSDGWGGVIKMAAAGKFLNVYQGAVGTATAGELAKSNIEPNGFFQLYLDYSPFLKIVGDWIKTSGEEMPEGFEELENFDMKLDFKMDFSKNGIEFVTEANIQK